MAKAIKEGLIYGHGISDSGKYERTVPAGDGTSVATHEYEVWRGIIRRCFDLKFQEKWHTYKGCSVSDKFKRFQIFAEWANEQVGFKVGNHCDKDLLIPNNKLYSEDTSVFLPPSLNMFLTKSNRKRGKFPIGVSYNTRDSVFEAYCHNGDDSREYLGRFKTPEKAFHAYKIHKELVAKHLAEKFKHEIDRRAYEALMNYKVNIND